MLIYILRRLALSVSVVAATMVATFLLFFLGPQNPAQALCGHSGNCTPQRLHDITISLGLNKPKIVQFEEYAKGVAVGRTINNGGFINHCDAPCLGWSYVQNRSVTDMIIQAFPVTLSIVVGGFVIYVFLALLLGVICARYRGRWIDRTIVGVSQFVPSIPYYILALMFFLYLEVFSGLVPRSTYTPITADPWHWATGLLGVWLLYGAFTSTGFIRYVRASMIDTQSQDYIRTARSKGISERRIAIGHALRAAITPFVTLLGLQVAYDLQGAIFTETIFTLPGIGLLAYTAIGQSDLPTISGTVIIGTVLVTGMNLVVDLMYGVIDPRVRLT